MHLNWRHHRCDTDGHEFVPCSLYLSALQVKRCKYCGEPEDADTDRIAQEVGQLLHKEFDDNPDATYGEICSKAGELMRERRLAVRHPAKLTFPR